MEHWTEKLSDLIEYKYIAINKTIGEELCLGSNIKQNKLITSLVKEKEWVVRDFGYQCVMERVRVSHKGVVVL